MKKQHVLNRLLQAWQKTHAAHTEQLKDQPSGEKREPLTNAVALSLAEQRIQAAIERGEFDNLQGQGQPLDLNDDLFVPEELRMAFRLLKGNGYAPFWIELRRDVQQEEQQLHAFQQRMRRRWTALTAEERAAARRHVESAVAELNSHILSYNLTAPSEQVHLPLHQLEAELARLEREQA